MKKFFFVSLQNYMQFYSFNQDIKITILLKKNFDTDA